MKRFLLLALAGLTATVSIAAAPVPAAKHAAPVPLPPVLVPHRATYEISLARTEPGGVVAATGRTIIEFRDACTGWSTTQRFVADMTNSEGDPARSDFIATSWESKDGTTMRFTVKNSVDGKTSQRFEGTALRASGGTSAVTLTIPRGRTFALPGGAIMPTEHTLDVLRAAAAGKTGFHQVVFQGGDKNDLYDATTVIGRMANAKELAADRANDTSGLLQHVGARSVLISYFAYGSQSTQPEYAVAYRLYGNGVVASMSLIYSRFTLKATLTKLEKLAPSCGR